MKKDNFVYGYITQPQAAKLAGEMYGEDKTFTSDLMNSYTWDTAIMFLQKFGRDKYSRQNSLNDSLAEKGTNYLTDATKQDKICNIWDMAGNFGEWSTETSSRNQGPCMGRGGTAVRLDSFTCTRGAGSDTLANWRSESFRVILYKTLCHLCGAFYMF